VVAQSLSEGQGQAGGVAERLRDPIGVGDEVDGGGEIVVGCGGD